MVRGDLGCSMTKFEDSNTGHSQLFSKEMWNGGSSIIICISSVALKNRGADRRMA